MPKASKAMRKLGSALLASWPVCVWRVAKEVRLSRGYNHFFYTKAGLLPADPYTAAKGQLLTPHLSTVVKGRTVLDLGAANGYFSLLAAQMGAKSVLGVERDKQLCQAAAGVARYLQLDQVEFESTSIYDLDTRYRREVVIALAIIHWFPHSNRPEFGTFDGIFSFLDQLAGESLIVEYIAPDDPTFLQDPILKNSPRLDLRQFGLESFQHSLRSRFSRVQHLGTPRSTRQLYLASR